jgi:hypothetical protein
MSTERISAVHEADVQPDLLSLLDGDVEFALRTSARLEWLSRQLRISAASLKVDCGGITESVELNSTAMLRTAIRLESYAQLLSRRAIKSIQTKRQLSEISGIRGI